MESFTVFPPCCLAWFDLSQIQGQILSHKFACICKSIQIYITGKNNTKATCAALHDSGLLITTDYSLLHELTWPAGPRTPLSGTVPLINAPFFFYRELKFFTNLLFKKCLILFPLLTLKSGYCIPLQYILYSFTVLLQCTSSWLETLFSASSRYSWKKKFPQKSSYCSLDTLYVFTNFSPISNKLKVCFSLQSPNAWKVCIIQISLHLKRVYYSRKVGSYPINSRLTNVSSSPANHT